MLARYHSERIGPVCEPDVNRPALLIQPGRWPTTWGVADMESLLPSEPSADESDSVRFNSSAWKRSVDDLLRGIDEDDDYEALVQQAEGGCERSPEEHVAHIRGELRRAASSLSHLYRLWNIPGERDMGAFLEQGLWSWLRRSVIVEASGRLIDADHVSRQDWSRNPHAVAGRKLRDLLPTRPMTRTEARLFATQAAHRGQLYDRDQPFHEAFDLLDALAARHGEYALPRWNTPKSDLVGDKLNELQQARRHSVWLRHLDEYTPDQAAGMIVRLTRGFGHPFGAYVGPTDRDIPFDTMGTAENGGPMHDIGEETANAPLEEMIIESAQPRPKRRSGPRRWNPPYDEVARHWWVLRDKSGDQFSQTEWLYYLEQQGHKVARTTWNRWTGEQITAGRFWPPPRVG